MVILTLPELLTLTLYIVTVSLLLIALATPREKAQKLSAAISLLFGTLASVSLYACYTGQSDDWFVEPPSSSTKTPGGKTGAGLGGGRDGTGPAATGIHRGAAATGGGTSEEDGGTDDGTMAADHAAKSPLGLVRASFAMGHQKSLPDKPFRDCRDCPEMVVVPAGFAPYGSDGGDVVADPSEKPQRIVRIARPFAIGRFEITIAEFGAYLASRGKAPRLCPGAAASSARLPVQCVSWNEARDYVAWLGDLTGKPYRLPSSSEWEYAARARTGTPYAIGAKLSPADANIGLSTKGVLKVGSFPPNGFGLSDMTGNVAELVAECWLPSLQNAPTDGAPAFRGADCSRRTLRDAAWFEGAMLARSAARRPIAPEHAAEGIGFRIARDLR